MVVPLSRPVDCTAIAPTVIMIAVLSAPIIKLPRSFPARKFSGRTLDRMISITRDDFSFVTRLPTMAANVIMNVIMMNTPR